MSAPTSHLELRSTITEDAILRVTLEEAPVPVPGPDQVLIQVEASPINPSDHGVLFGFADMSKATSQGSGKDTVLTAPVADAGMRAMRGRIGQPLRVGNEGAGTVVAAGDGAAAQALLGKRVATVGGGMYAQYRCAKAAECLPLLPEHSAKDGAAAFVNPLTALGFVETMRMEDHAALVHTAAASNLGQMLQRLCLADGIELVNIVRRDEQAQLLREQGATHVVNSNDADFMNQLIASVHETDATLGFDATGGGKLASQILTAMETAQLKSPGSYSVYGSIRHKQVYLYGALDISPTTLTRGYGMAWGVGGWLMPNFLARAGAEIVQRMHRRVVTELTSTFASHFTDEISLAEAIDANVARRHNAKVTGEKFLVCPQLAL